jgi:hypothetical protein
MNINDLIVSYTNKKDPDREPRKVGRYYASELGSIFGGWKKAKDFFEEEPKKAPNAKLIQEGVSAENHLTLMFQEMKVPVKTQEKVELKITDDIVIVVKTDYVFENAIVEFKTPRMVSKDIPDKWLFQLEATYRAFQKPVKLWQKQYPFTITEIDYEPSDRVWEFIQDRIKKYHEEVLEYQRSHNKLKK